MKKEEKTREEILAENAELKQRLAAYEEAASSVDEGSVKTISLPWNSTRPLETLVRVKKKKEKRASIAEEIINSGGEMGALIRAFDWSKTPLGPVTGWSKALCNIINLMLCNRFPMILWWGRQFIQFYNDAYILIPGEKHPQSALGVPGSECWSEIWHIIGPMIEAPFSGQPATVSDDLVLLIFRKKGFLQETHYKVAYSPVPDDSVPVTKVGGVLATVAETTEQVFGERQLRTLRELAAREAETKTPEDACQIASETLRENAYDTPFTLFYLVEQGGKQVRLVAYSGFTTNGKANPPYIDIEDESIWPLRSVVERSEYKIVSELGQKFGSLPSGMWSESPHSTIVLPLTSPDQPYVYGFLIVGLNPHREIDEGYLTFLKLASDQVSNAIRNAYAYQEERKRAEALAEIDRAKTAFFSNVSHEFRTPLTLILGPLEDILSSPAQEMSGQDRYQITVVYRNSQRLLKLVNTLLDFSRIEAGRIQASYEPTDLSSYTVGLASVFRSAIEKAGLHLNVDCPPLPEPVYVDREMWEKIILNLLSNAFKFTFEGDISVAMCWMEDHVEIEVKDTGTGIAPEEMPDLFERFHRIQGVRARTHEGTGIGLALVHELVKLHGGQVLAESVLGKGTKFTISIPTGYMHLPQDRIGTTRDLVLTSIGATPYIEEALMLLPGEITARRDFQIPTEDNPEHNAVTNCKERSRVLVVDDNKDMREYLQRLLCESYNVEAVADGYTALTAVQNNPPDLVLTDVMMPGLDGFELLSELRSDPATQTIPVIILSARAGEESRIEGLKTGADDYLIKPFSARELVAKIDAQLEIARIRREVLQQEKKLRAEAEDYSCRLTETLAERKRAEEELERSNQKINEILNSIQDDFYVLDHEWNFVYASELFTSRVGKRPEDFVGNNIWEMFPKYIGTEYEENVRAAMEKREIRRFEVGGRYTDACYRMAVYPSVEGITLLGTDITLQKKAEQVLRENESRLGELVRERTRELEEANHLLRQEISERKQAEEALRESEKRFRALVTASSEVMYKMSPEWSVMYQLQSRGFLANTERPNQNWLQEYIPPEDQPHVTAAIDEAIHTKRVFELEHRVWQEDGSLGWTFSRAVPLMDAKGEIIEWFGAASDITERKRAEEAIQDRTRELEAANQQIGDILESISDCFYSLDQDLRFSYVNKGAEEIWGLTRDELIGQKIEETFPSIIEISLDKFHQVLKEKAPQSFETFSKVIQRWVLINVYPTQDGISVYFQDITERKQAEEDLRQSEERFYKAFHSSPVMMSIIRLHDDCFLDVNHSWLCTMEYSREEIIGHRSMELSIWVDLEQKTQIIELIKYSGSLKNIEIKRRTKSGQIITCLLSTEIIKLGEEDCLLLSLIDITERKLIEKEIARLDRLNLVGEMAASIGHEIRNPMTTIRGFLQMLSEKDKNGKNRDYYDLMIEELDRANTIITDYLTMAKDKIVELQPRYLNSIVKAIYPMILADANLKDKQIRLDIDSPPKLLLDEKEMRQMILNLVRNGLEAMSPGGTLTIRTRAVDGEAILEVEDQGSGIPPNILEKLGTPFQTTKENGVGLGLPVCYSIAHRHNAKIEVDTGTRGTTFRVRFKAKEK